MDEQSGTQRRKAFEEIVQQVNKINTDFERTIIFTNNQEKKHSKELKMKEKCIQE